MNHMQPSDSPCSLRNVRRSCARWNPYAPSGSSPPVSLLVQAPVGLPTPPSTASSSSSLSDHSDISSTFANETFGGAPPVPFEAEFPKEEQREDDPDSKEPVKPQQPPPLDPLTARRLLLERNRFTAALVESAFSLLASIWHNVPGRSCGLPQDYKPVVFDPPHSSFLEGPCLNRKFSEATALPLTPPASPTTPFPGFTSTRRGSAFADFGACYSGLHPLRMFVHEVLRRSRTSCSTLQIALCYIQAVRPKVIATRLQALEESHRHLDSRRLDGADKTCHRKADLLRDGSALRSTGQVTASPTDSKPQSGEVVIKSIEYPAMDSPLLCARKTFLAALLLASKFLQDRAYSNKAWAKLSGLSPREVGRCERALGHALEWRLWVGKQHLVPDPSKKVVRCRSDGDLSATNALSAGFCSKGTTTEGFSVTSSSMAAFAASSTLSESSLYANATAVVSTSSLAVLSPTGLWSSPSNPFTPPLSTGCSPSVNTPPPDTPEQLPGPRFVGQTASLQACKVSGLRRFATMPELSERDGTAEFDLRDDDIVG